MSQAQKKIAQINHPQIEKARAKHHVLQRGTLAEQRQSMRMAGDLMWPLVAVAMSGGRLATRLELDTPTKRVLFKLSHPSFDWDALEVAVQRERAGINMNNAERDAHVKRAQLQADVLSGLTGNNVAIPFDGVVPQTGEFNRSLSGRRRFSLWADFQRSKFDALSKEEGDRLMSAFRKWSSEKAFYVCQTMEKVIIYLQNLPVTEVDLLRARYKADRLPLGRMEWRGRKPEEILAAAIISACVVSPSYARFRENPKLATKLIRAFDIYVSSCSRIERLHPKAYNSNTLKLKDFQRWYRG
jgi:hypothetical protein